MASKLPCALITALVRAPTAPATQQRPIGFESPEEVIQVATQDQYENAASTLPSKRTAREQELVKEAHEIGMPDIKNLDHAAHERERTYGSR